MGSGGYNQAREIKGGILMFTQEMRKAVIDNLDNPIKAREEVIKIYQASIEESKDCLETVIELKREVEKLERIPEDKIGICAVCNCLYDKTYSYAVCSDSCFRDRFM